MLPSLFFYEKSSNFSYDDLNYFEGIRGGTR